MNNRQIYNLFSYVGLFLLSTLSSNDLVMTSPEYLEEKSLVFIGKMGKDEFIKYPDIWVRYCSVWNVDMDNYRLMNIVNYLLSVSFYNFDQVRNQSLFFNNFVIYFGSEDSISCEDLRYRVHSVLLEYLDEIVNSRYLKLKSL